jgi:hypothetical protein
MRLTAHGSAEDLRNRLAVGVGKRDAEQGADRWRAGVHREEEDAGRRGHGGLPPAVFRIIEGSAGSGSFRWMRSRAHAPDALCNVIIRPPRRPWRDDEVRVQTRQGVVLVELAKRKKGAPKKARRTLEAPSRSRGASYDLGVGTASGAVVEDFLVVFLCFLVDFFEPSFLTTVSLFVSTDSVFLVSTFEAAVGFGAGAADC